MSTLYARLLDAHAHLFAARIQRTPGDDNIIAEHIEAADNIVRDALREIERTPPVITHLRPSYHRPAVGMRAADVLPDDPLPAWGTLVREMNGDDGEAA